MHHTPAPATRLRILATLAAFGAALPAAWATALSISVPNGSFELPSTNTPGFPVNVDLENWIDTPARPGFSGPVPWGFGTGSFPNPEVGQSNRLTNMDGNRAAYILASAELGFYQVLTSPAAVFSIGQSYDLTVGVSPQDGTPAGTVLSLSLFHLVSGAIAPIATTPVPVFADTNTFVDFSVTVPTVQPTDPWAGKPIGILLQVTSAPTENGGFDVDHVRLAQVPEPSVAVLLGTALLGLATSRHRADRRLA